MVVCMSLVMRAAALSAHAARVVASEEVVLARRRLRFDETWEATWRGMRLVHEADIADRILWRKRGPA